MQKYLSHSKQGDKYKPVKHRRQGGIKKRAAHRERLKGRLPLGSPQVCLLIMLLVWLRDFDMGSDCLLKLAEVVLSEVAASHEPQKQAAWKTSREQRGRKPSFWHI